MITKRIKRRCISLGGMDGVMDIDTEGELGMLSSIPT